MVTENDISSYALLFFFFAAFLQKVMAALRRLQIIVENACHHFPSVVAESCNYSRDRSRPGELAVVVAVDCSSPQNNIALHLVSYFFNISPPPLLEIFLLCLAFRQKSFRVFTGILSLTNRLFRPHVSSLSSSGISAGFSFVELAAQAVGSAAASSVINQVAVIVRLAGREIHRLIRNVSATG